MDGTNKMQETLEEWGIEMHQSQPTFVESSKQSKCRDLHPKWLHRETNDNTLCYIYLFVG